MAVMTLKTLVQRGVSVVTGGLAVEVRLGLGYQGDLQKPAPFSMRHPALAKPPIESDPDSWPAFASLEANEAAQVRAGRPAGWAGVPHGRVTTFGLRETSQAATCSAFAHGGTMARGNALSTTPATASPRGKGAGEI